MFHNISNPKWFGNWSRLEDDYLGNGGTDIADNFTFSKMEKTGGLFGSIVRLATAFPACDPETGHATGAWKVACESIDLDEVPLSDIADMISGFAPESSPCRGGSWSRTCRHSRSAVLPASRAENPGRE